MLNNDMSVAPNAVSFIYQGETVAFQGVTANDLILKIMREHGSFYELDVLERLHEILNSRTQNSVAVDAGAFIGTHSLFFAKFLGFARVFAFEANPSTYAILKQNMEQNGLGEQVKCRNVGLGRMPGWGKSLSENKKNLGMNTVVLVDESAGDTIAVTTIDTELHEDQTSPVALIKIDVEGMELDVVQGALETIERDRPVLCIEAHSAGRLVSLLWSLRKWKYTVADCLGVGAPTYIMRPTGGGALLAAIRNLVWVIYASVPGGLNIIKWYLKRFAQQLSG